MVSVRLKYACIDCGATVWRPERRCRPCHLKHRYPTKKTRDEKVAQLRRWHQATKDAVFAAYGGYRCVCCGETERVFLVIDHVNGGGNAERRKIGPQGTRGGAGQYWMLKKADYPGGYQVLCHNCNFARIRGACPHASKDP